MHKHLNTVTDLKSRGTKNTTPDSRTAAVTATAGTGEEGAAENDFNEAKETEAVLDRAAPPPVSVISKEQVLQLLKPGPHARSKSKGATATATTPTHEAGNGDLETDPSLEDKYVDLVDLLLPLPNKGEFDVNKIKSSVYFFS
jgi:DNA-directed RNA polymerase